MALIPATLARVVTLDKSDKHPIYIAERDGARHFAIEIGVFETMALLRKLDNIEAPRPMTHDLAGNIVHALGASIKEVRITAYKDHTFYAELVLETDEGEIAVDARPSDALVLAAGNKCDLLVNEEVFTQAAKDAM